MATKKPQTWTDHPGQELPGMIWALETEAYEPQEFDRVFSDDDGNVIEGMYMINKYARRMSIRDLPSEMHNAFFRAVNTLHTAQAIISDLFEAGEIWQKERETAVKTKKRRGKE